MRILCGHLALTALCLPYLVHAAVPSTRPVSGTLLDADGRPAAGVAVVRIVDGCAEDITDGVIAVDGDADAVRTDARGRFAFGPCTRPAGSFVAVTPAGRAFVAAKDFDPAVPLRVTPYAYAAGTVRVRDHVGAGERVNAWSLPTEGGAEEGSLGTVSVTVTADADGHYCVPLLGDEESGIGRVQPIDYGDNIPRRVLRVVPAGTTLPLDLGGGGRLVTFRTTEVDGLAYHGGHVYFTPDIPKIKAAEPDWPADSIHWDRATQEAFVAAWKATPAGRKAVAKADAAYRARDYYFGRIEPDGTVRLEDVLPGQYVAFVQARGVRADGVTRSLDGGVRNVTVTAPPPGEPDAPQTLADWPMKPRERLYAGDVAPDFDFAGFDGKRVKLSDYRGRWVLVHFWATWCGPCRGAMPTLKRIDARFGGPGGLVSLHVAEDDTMAAAQRYVTAEGLGGVQAWSGPSDSSSVVRRYGASAIPTMLLVAPDGRVNAVSNDADAIEAAVEKALLSPSP